MNGGAHEPQRPVLLVRALLGNAAFSGVCGAILLLAAAPARTWLGVSEGWILPVLAAGLLAFGAGLLLLARSERPGRTLVLAATVWAIAMVYRIVLRYGAKLAGEGRERPGLALVIGVAPWLALFLWIALVVAL